MLEPDSAEYKRKDTRESILTQARIMVGGDWHNCRILNISTGGAKLQIDRHINHGTPVSLQIGEFGQFNVTVAWQQSTEVGVKFTHDALEMAAVIMGLASYG
ncbi:MAG: PilZ domain-containing protein [Gallionella sp.]|nr:PilZ domain-containing protein [Gallionella sp.]